MGARVKLAWTIFKFNVIKTILRRLLKIHIWFEMRGK